METWDQNYGDLIKPAYFEFTADSLGCFVFGAVRGFVDAWVSAGRPYLE